MPPSVNKSNAEHYKSDTITEFKEFAGRSHYTCGEKGWEEIAGYALDWATQNVATGAGAPPVRTP